MNLREVLRTVAESSRADWHMIACWGFSSGPSYRDHLAFYETYEGRPNVLYADSHSNIAVYVPDVSITMAYGLEVGDGEYTADWTDAFPDKSAKIHFVDIFFNNALVYRDTYVSADGGGVALPVPARRSDGTLEVTEGACKLTRLLDSLGRAGSDFDFNVRRAGFKVVKTDWPDLG
jgi:hypothetical protein